MNLRFAESGPRTVAIRSNHLPLRTALVWAAVVSLALSTQLLFQPFVWRNFEVDEVLTAFVEMVGRRAVVGLSIAVAISAMSTLPFRSVLARAVGLGISILAGALIGEYAAGIIDVLDAPYDTISMLARVAQWCLIAAVASTLFFLARRASTVRAMAQSVELRNIRVEREIVQARLRALRSQIEPHFLFNTLATVRRLHQTEPDEGAQLLAHFLEYLRSTQTGRGQGRNTLGQEIDLVQAYLGMVAVRMSGRLTTTLDVAASLRDCECPALSIATLAENSVKHGIGPMLEGGRIEISAREVGDFLEVAVVDTGVGFSASSGSGIGLSNVRSRLRTAYGEHGWLTLENNEPSGVRAVMHLPSMRSG